ncbi:RagB/SusD family nutrient uptake outer membrane protein [Gaetbulibacter aestuarii]
MCLNISCSTLEEDTSSLLQVGVISTEADIKANIAPIYRSVLNTNNDPHYLRCATYGADDITTWVAGNKAPLRVFDRFDYGSGENSDINWLNVAWDNYWNTIYVCNTLIEGLKTSTAPENLVKLADGEARVFRAHAYLNLVKIYGNVPILLDGYLPTGDEQRATVVENYKQIESDLLIAENSLPAPGTEDTGRVSAGFAKTVLADLYLTWAGWPVKDQSKYSLAATKAKEIIDYGYYTLLPLDQLWTFDGAMSKETIFSVRVPSDESKWVNQATAFTFHQGRGFSDCFPELRFFYDFPEGPRKDYTFLLDIPNRGVKDGAMFDKTPATIPWQDSDRAHPMYRKYVYSENLTVFIRPVNFRPVELYRYAEVLLIYAEAQARLGENSSSIEALNEVKRRAAGLPYNVANGTVDVASATPNEIVDEKGWELAAENKRWFDLVRTERVAEMAAKRDPSEPVTLVRMPTEAQYIAPIPAQSINNSKLLQNPEGFKIN